MGKFVGIDLGTTFSVVAYIDDNGNPQVIPNHLGENTTASAVFFDKGKELVGTVAKRKSTSDPGDYQAFVKRHMGERTYSFTNNNGETYNAESLSGIILAQLKKDAEAYLGDKIEGAVITVPAYFSDPQRQATKDAASIAEIPVLGMINEPTAAAIAFGIQKNVSRPMKIIVYDFGGGTFDVSILEIDGDNIHVIATDGDHRLGGYDIDQAISNYVIEELEQEGVNISSDAKAKQRLMIAAENAKKELSSASETDITVYVKGEEYTCNLTRETFEDLIESIIDTTISFIQGTVEEAGLTYDQIDKILLVGGSTRIPVVQKAIEEETGIKPSNEVHPDEAVAIGAAYRVVDLAKQMAETSAVEPAEKSSDADSQTVDIDTSELPDLKKNYNFQDVTSHGIGIVTYNEEEDKDENSVILPKNTPIPAEFEKLYSTSRPYQEEVKIQVTSGEDEEVDYVTIIGKAVMKVKPRRNLVPIKVIINCDSNAIIHARAIDLDENVDLGEITIDRSEHNMTEQQVKQATKRIHELNIGD